VTLVKRSAEGEFIEKRVDLPIEFAPCQMNSMPLLVFCDN
jgi:hypothetical protein